jgi:cobalt-zinc-cadmium resistance protein CzcA
MFLNSIIGFSIKNKLIIGLFTISLILYGAYELTRLPIDAVPDITNNQVQVITIAPSLGATDIERLVTFPVEQANSNIPGLHEIRSFSRFGLSLVTIVFDEGVDIYWARQQVSERLQSAKALIPPGVASPELGPVTTGLGEIYQYVIRPKKGYEHKYTSVELRTIQDWIVRRQLLSVKGVADVSSFGGLLKQYEIAIDPDKLQSMDISIEDVFNAIQSNNENTGGAYIEKGPTVLYIRTEGLVNSISDLGNIPVKVLKNGVSLLVRDIAEVKLGTAVRYGAMHYDTLGEVAGAVVMMLKGGNSSEVIKDVKERVELIQKSLPEGVVIEPFLDRTKMVNNAIGTVETNLLEGALIVIFVLVLFLGNVRAGLLVASVIPLSMLFAVIMMNTFGVSGNLMSLGALDFGLIVDGAVIIVEAVMHALTNHSSKIGFLKLEQNKMDETVKHSASKMMNSAVFGQIIILIVYLPIFSLQGIEGKMFKPMAQTVAFALMGAFILSLTYIPMMSSVFLSKTIHTKKNLSDKMMEKLEGVYRTALNKTLNYPKIVLTSVLALFTIAIIVLMQLGGEFIPTLEEGDFALETRVLPGSNLNVSLKAAKQASAILMTKFPEVEKVVAKIGSGEVPTDPMPIDAQDLMIILKDKKEWTSAKTFNELAEKMGEALKDVPGVTFGFQYPVQMRFNELMTGARQDVVCKIFGENLDTLAHYAAELGKIASVVDGAQDVYVEPVAGIPQIVINYKRDLIARYGVKISDVNRAVNTAFAGGSAGKVYEGEKRFDLVVRLNKNQRQELSDVQNLLIPVGPSMNVPLYHLADVEIKDGPNQIQREDAKRRIVVGFNVRGRDVQSIVDDLQTKIAQKVKLPAGYYITYGGAFENLNAAKKRLGIAVPIALFLIFLLLFFAFNSSKQAALIFTAIPLSAIGGILALAMRGMPFSISAGVGFIALFGVAVLNGID